MCTGEPCPHGRMIGSCRRCDPYPVGSVWPLPDVHGVMWHERLEVKTHRPLEIPALPVGTALETPRRVYGVPPSQNLAHMRHMIRTRRGAGPHL
jgi:hypothetical protein